MLKAVLFDVDGVLVDSSEANIEFYARLLEKAGYKRPPRERIHQQFHLTMWGVIEKLTNSSDSAEIQRIWDMGNDAAMYPSELLKFPDALEGVLGELSRQYDLAIVTSRVKRGVDALYAARDIAKFFKIAVTYEDYVHPKPHAEPLQVALKKLGIQPTEAVYVGDSHVDIESANAAGVWSIYLAPKVNKDATVGVTDFADIPQAVAKVDVKFR